MSHRTAATDAQQGVISPLTTVKTHAGRSAVTQSTQHTDPSLAQTAAPSIAQAIASFAAADMQGGANKLRTEVAARQGTDKAINDIDAAKKNTGLSQFLFGDGLEYRHAQQSAASSAALESSTAELDNVDAHKAKTPEEYSQYLTSVATQFDELYENDKETADLAKAAFFKQVPNMARLHQKAHYAHTQTELTSELARSLNANTKNLHALMQGAETTEERAQLSKQVDNLFKQTAEYAHPNVPSAKYNEGLANMVVSDLIAGNPTMYAVATRNGWLASQSETTQLTVEKAHATYQNKHFVANLRIDEDRFTTSLIQSNDGTQVDQLVAGRLASLDQQISLHQYKPDLLVKLEDLRRKTVQAGTGAKASISSTLTVAQHRANNAQKNAAKIGDYEQGGILEVNGVLSVEPTLASTMTPKQQADLLDHAEANRHGFVKRKSSEASFTTGGYIHTGHTTKEARAIESSGYTASLVTQASRYTQETNAIPEEDPAAYEAWVRTDKASIVNRATTVLPQLKAELSALEGNLITDTGELAVGAVNAYQQAASLYQTGGIQLVNQYLGNEGVVKFQAVTKQLQATGDLDAALKNVQLTANTKDKTRLGSDPSKAINFADNQNEGTEAVADILNIDLDSAEATTVARAVKGHMVRLMHSNPSLTSEAARVAAVREITQDVAIVGDQLIDGTHAKRLMGIGDKVTFDAAVDYVLASSTEAASAAGITANGSAITASNDQGVFVVATNNGLPVSAEPIFVSWAQSGDMYREGAAKSAVMQAEHDAAQAERVAGRQLSESMIYGGVHAQVNK